MKKILMASILSMAQLCSSAVSTGCLGSIRDKEIHTAIHSLNPKLSNKDSEHLERAVYEVINHSACKTNWKILLAVAYKESSLKKNKINSKTHDYGLMQINEKNILRLNLSRGKLLSDETYALEVGCRILDGNARKYSAKYRYWIGIYQAGTALWKVKVRNTAKRYDSHVRRIASRIGYNPRQVQYGKNDLGF